MSFLGGPECSSSSNPLAQFQKHTQGDNALQHDRLVNTAPGAAFGGFRSAPAPAPQDQAINGFLNGVPGLQQDMTPRLLDPSASLHLRASSASPGWAQDFHKAGPIPMDSTFNADDLSRFHNLAQPGASSSTRSSPLLGASAQIPQHRPMMGVGMVSPGMGFGVMNQPVYHQPMYHHHHHHQQQQQKQQQKQPQDVAGKGKGKVVELDDHKWEQEFAQLELQEKRAQQESGGTLAADGEPDQLGRTMPSETNVQGDFESIWKGIQAEAAANKTFDLGADGEWSSEWQSEFPEFSDVGRFNDSWVESYLYEPDNLFSNQPNAFDEGVRIMKEGGNLSLAALAFEAAAQQKPDHTEAWVCLGNAQAQNEKETAAIRAHEHALTLDPNNLAALMGLAVSYTNEGYEAKAYRSLERWLASKYPQVLSPSDLHPPADVGYADRAELHSSVTRNFIRAAQLSPDGEHMDPDVQVGLGVLFYGIEEYDKAIDCFQSALASSQLGTSNRRDQVHLLWNRLGATLANSGRPEEAVSAYQQALSIKPNFVRARYNLGVSCINIHCYQEAAQHLLSALGMHKSIEKSARNKAYEILAGGAGMLSSSASGERNPALDAQLDRMTAMNMSTTLYDTLRRVFNLMQRDDLAAKTVAGVDPDIFKGEFEF